MKITPKNIDSPEKVYFGYHKEMKEKIYLFRPKWDCGWYWGFGYLGNENCHYHLHNYANGRKINMYDALKNDYVLNTKIERDLWKFCELVKTIYSLRETGEILNRGGSHYSSNPFKELIKNDKEYKRINEIVLPEMMQYLMNMFN